MKSRGVLSPESESEARKRFAELAHPASEVTRVVARGLQLEREEYRARVTDDVVQAAQEALFGSILLVHTGTTDEFEEWRNRNPYTEYSVHREGSEQVARTAWHVAPMANKIVVATYQDHPEAAIAMLRRISWSRLYRPLLTDNAEDS